MRYIVALSGGKDSTAMALRLKELYPNRYFEYVLTPTGDELPDMKVHWKMLRNRLGNLTKLNTKTLFQVIKEQKMIPNFRARFCSRILKVDPFINFMKSINVDESIMYVGLRADEEGRLGIIDTEVNSEYPMREWGWGINDVWKYLDSKNIVIPERTDCGCCFWQRLPEWKNLLYKHPERFESYVQLEKKMGHTFRTPGKDTWPTSLEDLRKEILSGRKMRNTKARGSKSCRICSM